MESPRSGRLRRVPWKGMAEGAALGLGLWCVLLELHVMPGKLAGESGVAVFALAGMLLRVSRVGRAFAAVVGAAAITVGIIALTSIAAFISSRWVRNDQLPASPVDAVVALSASVKPDSTISSEGVDHLLTALELIQARRARVLVTTRVAQYSSTYTVTSDIDQERIVGMLGAGVEWLRAPLSGSTRDEAVGSSQLLVPLGMKRIAVVASPMHTRRACAVFEAVGFQVTCVASRLRSPGGLVPAPWPRDRLTVVGEWVYEVAAMVKYRARGWLPARGKVEPPT